MALGTIDGKRAEYGSGSFRVTNSGSVEYRFSYVGADGETKRKSITAESINDCIKKAELFRQKVNLYERDIDPYISMAKILRKAYKRDFDLGHVKEQGYCRNLANLSILEKSRIARMPIVEVTKSDVVKYFSTLSKYSESTVAKLHSQVKLAFSLAKMDSIIEDNFMERRDMKCPKVGKPTTKVMALTPRQQKMFVEHLENNDPPNGRNDYRLQLMIELYSGMRMGEINALRREDIDFEKNVIHVRRTISRGFEYREFLNDTTKTGAGQRDVPISKRLRPYLEKALEKQRYNEEDLIFYDYNKRSVISTSQVNNYYKRVCDKLGIPALGQHALRHTFATRCIESGIPAVVLKNWLGHTNIHITLDTYTDVFSGMNNVAVDNLDKYLDKI